MPRGKPVTKPDEPRIIPRAVARRSWHESDTFDVIQVPNMFILRSAIEDMETAERIAEEINQAYKEKQK